MLIDPKNSQVLIIDVQPRLAAAMPDRDRIVGNCSLLLNAAREIDVPVLASEQYPQGLGETVPTLAELIPSSQRLAKMEFSCLRNAELASRLETVAKEQVVLAGMEAHVCVLQTAFDLVGQGKDVFVVADAVGSRKPESKETALSRLAAAGAAIVTTEMVAFEWLGSASAPAFRTISKLIR